MAEKNEDIDNDAIENEKDRKSPRFHPRRRRDRIGVGFDGDGSGRKL